MANSQSSDGSAYGSDSGRLGQSMTAVKDDAKALGHSVADAARTGVAELKQGAHNAVDAAKDKLHGVSDAAKEKLSAAKDAAMEAASSLKDVIAKHPVASIGIAAGIGMLVGLALFRPRS